MEPLYGPFSCMVTSPLRSPLLSPKLSFWSTIIRYADKRMHCQYNETIYIDRKEQLAS